MNKEEKFKQRISYLVDKINRIDNEHPKPSYGYLLLNEKELNAFKKVYTMINRDEIISYDFQGWPVCKMNIRDILQKLGATLNLTTQKWEITENSTLDIYPITVVDDGMGYGVNEEYITEVNLRDGYCTIFREKEDEELTNSK